MKTILCEKVQSRRVQRNWSNTFHALAHINLENCENKAWSTSLLTFVADFANFGACSGRGYRRLTSTKIALICYSFHLDYFKAKQALCKS